jgi:putative toxin-antitoxin system antitoxin component (TIGR02293 family)
MEKNRSKNEDPAVRFTVASGPARNNAAHGVRKPGGVQRTTERKVTVAPNPGADEKHDDNEAVLHSIEQKLGLTEALTCESDLVIAIEKQLPLAVIDALLDQGLQEKEIYSLIVPRRTLQHRRTRKEKLSIEESDRAVRVARITTLSEKVFGDAGAGMRWLRKPKKRFSERSAIAMMGTEAGSRLVEEMLYQIDEGMAA